METVDRDIGYRIKQLRQDSGLTQQAFAASVGIVQGFLSALENGRKLPSDTLLIALCHQYRVRREWLVSGQGVMQDGEPSPVVAGVPLLRRISAAFPAIPPEDIAGTVALPDLAASCYAIRCEGDFMAPTIIDGDLVIFQPGAAVANKDIVLVTNRWGEVILRRYRLRGDEVYLAAENAAYSPFRPDPQTRTLGKVVGIWRKVKI